MKLRSLSASLLAFLLVLAVVVPALADDPLEARLTGPTVFNNFNDVLWVSGTHAGISVEGDFPATPIPMEIDGSSDDVAAYCIDIEHTAVISSGGDFPYVQQDWDDATQWQTGAIPNKTDIQRVTYIIDQFDFRESAWVTTISDLATPTTSTADTSTPQIRGAAIQAAIWHFSDGFELGSGPGPGGANDLIRPIYDDIIVAAKNNSGSVQEPTLNLSIDPATAQVPTNALAGPFTVTGVAGPITLAITGDGTIVDATGTTVTTVGPGQDFFVQFDGDPNSLPSTATIDATATAEYPSGLLFDAGDERQKVIAGSKATAKATVSAEVTFTAPTPELSLTKGADESTVEAGDPFTYTLTAMNAAGASATATNVTVTDTVPTPLDIVSTPTFSTDDGVSETECTVDGQDVTCDIGDLAVGQTATVEIDVSVPAELGSGSCGPLNNTAYLDADQLDSDLSASASVDVACDATVTVIKQVPDGEEGWQPAEGWEFSLAYNSTTVTATTATSGQHTFTIPAADLPENDESMDASLTEVLQAGWNFDSATCEVNGVAFTPSSIADTSGVTFAIADGDDITCTFENTPLPVYLEVDKEFDGSDDVPFRVDLSIDDDLGTFVELADDADDREYGGYVLLDVGSDLSYSVTEDLPSGYQVQSGVGDFGINTMDVQALLDLTDGPLACSMEPNVRGSQSLSDVSTDQATDGLASVYCTHTVVNVPVTTPTPVRGSASVTVDKEYVGLDEFIEDGQIVIDDEPQFDVSLLLGGDVVRTETVVAGDSADFTGLSLGTSYTVDVEEVGDSVTASYNVVDAEGNQGTCSWDGVSFEPETATVTASRPAGEVTITATNSYTCVFSVIEEAPDPEPEETPDPEDTTEVTDEVEETTEVLGETVDADAAEDASDPEVLSRTGTDLVLLTPLGLLLAALGLAVLRFTNRRRTDAVR